jgi:hypothetical protein
LESLHVVLALHSCPRPQLYLYLCTSLQQHLIEQAAAGALETYWRPTTHWTKRLFCELCSVHM